MRTLLGTVDGVVDTQQLNGKTYLVVPVVAIVEGVLHAGNAKFPELAPATAFGKLPDTWNGRPVVVDHPLSETGQAISASRPEVLEQYYLGQIMNANLDDKKLRVQAWIDLDANSDRADAVTTMLTRIAAQEVIEVSIGAYVFTHEASGTYNGKDYQAVWDMVIPDHLAFLSAQIGACSIEDGCGAFRTDSRREYSPAALHIMKHYEDNSMTCKCHETVTKPATDNGNEDTAIEVPVTTSEHDIVGTLARICLANGLYDKDVRALLSNALREEGSYNYLITFSDSHMVYETYEGGDYVFYQRSYSIDADNKVTLGADGVKVLFQTKVVALSASEQTEDDPDEQEPTEELKGETEVTDTTNEDSIVLKRDASVEEAVKAFESTSFGQRINAALEVEQSVRDEYVGRILASPANKLSKEKLAAMETSTLASIAELATASQAKTENNGGEDTDDATETVAPATNAGRSGGTVRQGAKAPVAPTVFTQEYLEDRRKRSVAA